MEKIILRGIPASPGIAIGKIKIIKSAKDISKLKAGDIAVAKFLTPDFVAGLKLYAAPRGIVTNEGGVTCHAAIIARELKIPYIAGANKATKKLKIGSSIKMDARTGIIYEAV